MKHLYLLIMGLLISAPVELLAQSARYSALPLSVASLIEFDSQNCTGFWGQDLQCKPIKIKAYLFQPPAVWKSAVVVSHGAQGVDLRVFEYADALVKSGVAALVIDHWSPRAISRVGLDYAAATLKGASTSTIAVDAIFASSDLKIRYPQIKSMAFLGESMGGMAAIQLSKQRLTDLFNSGTLSVNHGLAAFVSPFSALVGLYPACLEKVEGEKFISTPFLILSGEKDDHTLAKHCVDYQGWVNQNGGALTTQVIPNVHHDFDAPHALEYRARGQNGSKCQSYVTKESITVLSSGKVLPNNLAGQAQLPRECTTYGLRSGHVGDKFVAVPIWLEFLKAKLQPD